MRADCSWSMSTAGLTAQGLPLPPEDPPLHGRCLQRTADDTPCWSPAPDLHGSDCGLDATPLEQNHRKHQQVSASERQYSHTHSPVAQRLPPNKPRPAPLSLSSCPEPRPEPRPLGDEHVVPSFQRLSMYERSPPPTPSRASARGSRPLPPLPGRAELSRERSLEDGAELFSRAEDSRSCPRPPPLRPGDLARRSFRGHGKVNYAYLEGPWGAHGPAQCPGQATPPEQATPPNQATPPLRERAHRRLRRSQSGPTLRQPCLRHAHPSQDGPQVPPRIPIPPRTFKMADPAHRWSTEASSGGYSDEDRPPKVPPREPTSPNPSSVPSYLNGVMPPTQSFAPDPKYVSRTLQRQNSEGSPCILPIMEQGRKASHTHYFLLPQRPAYLDRLERFLRGAECEQRSCDWSSRPHTDLV